MHKRYSEQLGFLEWANVHSTYQSCTCAEYEAFVDRHLLEFSKTSSHFAWWAFKHIIDWPKLSPYTDEELIQSRPQRMRKRYRSGLEIDLDIKRQSRVMMFVKEEQMNLSEKRKAPRAIQYRGSTYTAHLAKYCVPLEKHLGVYPLLDNYGWPILTKGRNAFQLGHLVYNAFNVGRRFVHLIDHSAYDAHINLTHLAIERYVMNQVFNDDDLEALLKAQRKNVVYSKNGIKVKCTARRMSGDANTSLGGSIINYMMLRYLYPDAIIFANGDDSIVYSNLDQPAYDFSDVGMVSVVSTVQDLESIEYCQMRPVIGSYGCAMVKNPERVLNRKLLKLSKAPIQDWFRSTGLGELYASPYDPVSQSIAHMFLELAGDGKVQWSLTTYQQREMGKGLPVIQWDRTSLVSYCLAWDLTPSNIYWLVTGFATAIGAQCCQQWQRDVAKLVDPLIMGQTEVERTAIMEAMGYHNLELPYYL